jgi:hypothetical protein
MTTRIVGLSLVVSVGLCVLCFLRAHQLIYSPDFLPGWDASGYVLRGLNIHDALASFDIEKLISLIGKPDIRPPAFSLMLGTFMLFAGTKLTVGTLWAQAAFFVSLGLLIGMGARLGGLKGAWAGGMAAVLTAAGLDHLAMIMVPMSESTTLLTMLGVTLGILFLLDRGIKGQVGVGFLLLWAGLIRYNLPVMIGVPLLLWHLWEALCFKSRPLLSGAPIAWLMPGALYFGVWWLLKPELPDQIEKFLVNRSSGLEFWSAENLLFFPTALTDAFLGPEGWVIFALFTVNLISLLRPVSFSASSPGIRLVQLQVLAGIAALTLHDYKLARNLYGTLPSLYLMAFLPLTALSGWMLYGLFGLSLAGAVGLGVISYTERIPSLLDRYHFEPDPSASASLRFIKEQSTGMNRIWITGTNDTLSPPLIELYLRSEGVDAKLLTKALPQVPRTRTGIDPSWNDQYQQIVAEEFLGSKHLNDTCFITIETLPGSRRFRGGQKWTNYQNNYARAFAQQTVLPEIGKLTLPEGGLQLVAYAAKKTTAAISTVPFYEDDFSTGGKDWVLVPEKELPPEGIYRGEGTIRFTIPLAINRLQYCSPIIPAPASFSTQFELVLGNIQGRAVVLQLREVDAAGALLKDEEGKALIHRVGPVPKDGAHTLKDTISLADGKPGQVKACVILEGFAGEVTVDRVLLY